VSSSKLIQISKDAQRRAKLSFILAGPIALCVSQRGGARASRGRPRRASIAIADLPGQAPSATTLEHVAYYTMGPSAGEERR
jgi:hypothetical protein